MMMICSWMWRLKRCRYLHILRNSESKRSSSAQLVTRPEHQLTFFDSARPNVLDKGSHSGKWPDGRSWPDKIGIFLNRIFFCSSLISYSDVSGRTGKGRKSISLHAISIFRFPISTKYFTRYFSSLQSVRELNSAIDILKTQKSKQLPFTTSSLSLSCIYLLHLHFSNAAS